MSAMTIHHHPSEELLLDYASGGIHEAFGVAIATHVALCPECRAIVADMEAIGGAFLDTVDPSSVGDDTWAGVVSRLQDAPQQRSEVAEVRAVDAGNRPILPQPLRSYLGGDVDALKWRWAGVGAAQIVLPTSEGGAKARLLRIPAGRPVPHHTHGGLELTLVLAGAYSDDTGTFARGDLQEADESLKHQPHAAKGEDCICLAVTDTPLRFSSFAARMLQPFFGI